MPRPVRPQPAAPAAESNTPDDITSTRLLIRQGRLAATQREAAGDDVESREPDEIFEAIVVPQPRP